MNTEIEGGIDQVPDLSWDTSKLHESAEADTWARFIELWEADQIWLKMCKSHGADLRKFIVEFKYLENSPGPFKVWLRQKDKSLHGIIETAVVERCQTDEDSAYDAWHHLTEVLSEMMTAVHPEKHSGKMWTAEGRGLGWQRNTGHKEFMADDGEALLSAVLPKTDCTFAVFNEKDRIKIVNSHHDANREVYVIYPMPETAEEGEK